MSKCGRIYQKHHIKGHPAQYFVTALLIKYLSGRYPKAWELNGRQVLLTHMHNLDERNQHG